MLQQFSAYWGEQHLDRFLDRDLNTSTTRKESRAKPTPTPNPAIQSDPEALLKAIGQAFGTLSQPNSVGAADRQLSPGPPPAHTGDVVYTTITELLAKLTRAEAGRVGGRDFMQYAANFAAEDLFAVNKIQLYTADDFVHKLTIRRGTAEALRIAVAKEVALNGATPVVTT